MKHIREQYEKHGAEGYYRSHAADYENPHFPQVRELVTRNYPSWNCGGRAILDFCAGGGEVTLALRGAGHRLVYGSDPFTWELYQNNTGIACEKWAFEDIIKGAEIGHYQVIISSFAMHLCPEKDLFPLVWALFGAAPLLVVITPHKRPELEKIPGVELIHEDFELTDRGKKVRLKTYAMPGRG